jgi:hypothetical protein
MPITTVSEQSQLSKTNQAKQSDTVYDHAQTKKEQNNAIVQSQIAVNLNAGNEPMALLFKTALVAINEILDPTQETKPIQSAYDDNIDTSPEATSKRIISLATGFFNAYQLQNPDSTLDDSLDKFMSTISSGIETGFKDARDILESLSVLNGNIASDIDTTYALVQEGLKNFADNFFNTVDATKENSNQL